MDHAQLQRSPVLEDLQRRFYTACNNGDLAFVEQHLSHAPQTLFLGTDPDEVWDRAGTLRAVAERSRLSDVLSSAIGADEAMPVVTRLQSEWQNVHLLCTDGLTKHVSDERIAERLKTMTSAKQCCEALLQDALDGGGSDNITIVVGRALAR